MASLLTNISKVIGRGVSTDILMAVAQFRYRVPNPCCAQNWREFKKVLGGRDLVLYGDWGAKSFIKLYGGDIYVKAVIDDTPHFKSLDTPLGLIEVKDISYLDTLDEERTVLLVTQIMYHEDIYFEIVERGFQYCFSYCELESRRNAYRVAYPLVFIYGWHRRLFLRHSGRFYNYVTFHIKALARVLVFAPLLGSFKRLRSLRNRYAGERCFILATGPSVVKEDLELLEHEYTFGVNSIFRILSETNWRPTYYCLSDIFLFNNFMQQEIELDFQDYCKELAFLGMGTKKQVCSANCSEKLEFIPVSYLSQASSNKRSRFFAYSRDPVWGTYNAWTVVAFAMNLAQYMGFKQIYLLGVDCNYVGKQHFDGTKAYDITNYRQAIQSQKNLIAGFTYYKDVMNRLGVQVFNSTRGGNLEVFERRNLEDVIREKKEVPFAGVSNLVISKVITEESEEDVVLSVVVLTYNHERFIRQALDSILMQKTDFRFEVLIGDDCSTDGTSNILKEYQTKYPGFFTVFFRKENLGASRNYYELLMTARGKYIAFLETDDYWITRDKLQRQVEFLENPKNLNYVGCASKLLYVRSDGTAINDAKITNAFSEKKVFTLTDYQTLHAQHGVTRVFRNVFLNTNHDYTALYKINRQMSDKVLNLILLTQGDIFTIGSATAAYRYIRNGESANYSSKYNERLDILFGMLVALERYAQDEFGRSVDLQFFKRMYERHAIGAVKANRHLLVQLKVLFRIANYTENPHETRKIYWKKLRAKAWGGLMAKKPKRIVRTALRRFAHIILVPFRFITRLLMHDVFKKLKEESKRATGFYQQLERSIEDIAQKQIQSDNERGALLTEVNELVAKFDTLNNSLKNEISKQSASIQIIKEELKDLATADSAVVIQEELKGLEILAKTTQDKSNEIRQSISKFEDVLIPFTFQGQQKIGEVRFAREALQILLRDYEFVSVLDIGGGGGEQAEVFAKNGKKVTAIDLGTSVYFLEGETSIEMIIGDFNEYQFEEQYDCVWCSHVLEHQLAPNLFLSKVFDVLKDDGVLALTVPPAKHEIVGGHVSLWNAGLLLYHLVLAGFDCKLARVLRYEYNISIILNKKRIEGELSLTSGPGDISAIMKYLPEGLAYKKIWQDYSFDGDIHNINWAEPEQNG